MLDKHEGKMNIRDTISLLTLGMIHRQHLPKDKQNTHSAIKETNMWAECHLTCYVQHVETSSEFRYISKQTRNNQIGKNKFKPFHWTMQSSDISLLESIPWCIGEKESIVSPIGYSVELKRGNNMWTLSCFCHNNLKLIKVGFVIRENDHLNLFYLIYLKTYWTLYINNIWVKKVN